MDDLVYRQATIDVVHHTIYDFFCYCEDDDEIPMTKKDKMLFEINKKISNSIKDLPSAHTTADVQEVKHGEWKMQMLPRGVALFYCSECGFGKHTEDNRSYRFCPNCGADMRERSEDA